MKNKRLWLIGALAITMALIPACGSKKDDESVPPASAEENAVTEPAGEEDPFKETIPPEEFPEEPETGSQLRVQDLIALAKGCIGQEVSALYAACGEPNDSSYEEDPVSKATVGYLFYDSFTVTTKLDEAGAETVSAVW